MSRSSKQQQQHYGGGGYASSQQQQQATPLSQQQQQHQRGNHRQQQQQQHNSNYHNSSSSSSCCPRPCMECYNPSSEMLEYDYTYDDTHRKQPYPRIRDRGEYYIDSYNDQPWSWSFGTNESNGIWCNSSDQAGTIMSAMVWLLLLYSASTITALTITEGIPVILGMIYNIVVALALACHAKTSLTDPGSVPVQAIPSERQRLLKDSHSMCGQCQTFKPPGSHHCRICNRCISRME